MPMYEFECEKCGKKVDVIQKYEDSPPEHCECPMKRNLAGGQVFEFKGTGFYKTDYPNKKDSK